MPASFRERRNILLLVFFFRSLFQLSAQTDLISPDSHNSVITKSDSANYKAKHYKPRFDANLPVSMNETSGLLYLNGQLWTINDSGNKPEIYQVDRLKGSVLRTVVIRNAVNTDWESITQDDSNIYIGDFGNNTGNRTNLCILKIGKTDLLNLANDTLNAGYIHFSYPDQDNFSIAFNNNNFDCEAFFFSHDSLHLFSKNWSDMHTKHYVVPVDTGNYNARFAEQFNADGLITDAAINEKGNVVLLGYKNSGGRSYTCFAWLLSGYEGSSFFNGSKQRVELGSAFHLGQTEGIVLKNDNTGWLSSESIKFGWFHKPAKLYNFNFSIFF